MKPTSIDDVKETFKKFLSEKDLEIYLTLSPETIQEYREIFDIFNETGDGYISNDEIGKVMLGLGYNPTKERIKELVNEIDLNGDGQVSFDEFLCLMVKTLRDEDEAEEELVEVFRRFDLDNDGKIGWEDLVLVFTELGYTIDAKEAKEMIGYFDHDADQCINFSEFVQLMMYDATDESLLELNEEINYKTQPSQLI